MNENLEFHGQTKHNPIGGGPDFTRRHRPRPPMRPPHVPRATDRPTASFVVPAATYLLHEAVVSAAPASSPTELTGGSMLGMTQTATPAAIDDVRSFQRVAFHCGSLLRLVVVVVSFFLHRCVFRVSSFCVPWCDSEEVVHEPAFMKVPFVALTLHCFHEGQVKLKENQIVVLVGTVTDDIRVDEVPAMKVTAVIFTKTARDRNEKAGGECLPLTCLFSGLLFDRTWCYRGIRVMPAKHFGPAPGMPHNDPKPYAQTKGRKFDRARGRSNNRGIKVIVIFSFYVKV
ncbi:60S ribosomal protein L18 [Striga asiatica]|uniref:60S ribosomal protein L18 n=1 Tax=Striga asiatica TaxID=4170 RepID=A0A5A7QHB5_STRAF|nr:60S ribosomal protein L18 [Striga asiatica]